MSPYSSSDADIGRVVYELYGPTLEETAPVEAATNNKGLKGRNVIAQGAASNDEAQPWVHGTTKSHKAL